MFNVTARILKQVTGGTYSFMTNKPDEIGTEVNQWLTGRGYNIQTVTAENFGGVRLFQFQTENGETVAIAAVAKSKG